VPERVVYLLETVQVKQQHGGTRAVAGGLAQGLVGPVEEQGAVGQSCQFVVRGLVHGVVEGFVHGLDSAGVVEGQAGMVRETDQDVAFGLRVGPALAPGSDRKTADRPPSEMDRCGHGGAHSVIGESPDRGVCLWVVLRHAQPVLDDGPPSDPGTDGSTGELGEELARYVHRRHHDHDVRFGLVDEP
jgi:hypothetical protein